MERGRLAQDVLGAAQAGCFSMFLAAVLGRAGHPPTSVDTDAAVQFEKEEAGWRVTRITLTTRAVVPGIDTATFQASVDLTGVDPTGGPVSLGVTVQAVDPRIQVLDFEPREISVTVPHDKFLKRQ